MSEALEITKADFDADKENYLDRVENGEIIIVRHPCLLYTSPSPRDLSTSRMPSSA